MSVAVIYKKYRMTGKEGRENLTIPGDIYSLYLI